MGLEVSFHICNVFNWNVFNRSCSYFKCVHLQRPTNAIHHNVINMNVVNWDDPESIESILKWLKECQSGLCLQR